MEAASHSKIDSAEVVEEELSVLRTSNQRLVTESRSLERENFELSQCLGALTHRLEVSKVYLLLLAIF